MLDFDVSFRGNVQVAKQSEAGIVNGCRGSRVLVGDASCVLCCCEEYNTLSLDLMKLEIHSIQAETVKGVPVSVTGISQIKVLANKMVRQSVDGAGGGPMNQQMDRQVDDDDQEWVMSPEQDLEKILLAAQHFLGSSKAAMEDSIRSTMEGHQRQILGTLTVEELYKDRAKFSSRVR
jgi:flotillin